MTDSTITLEGKKYAPLIRRLHHHFCNEMFRYFSGVRHKSRHADDRLFALNEQWFNRLCNVAFELQLACVVHKLQRHLRDNHHAVQFIDEVLADNRRELEDMTESMQDMPDDDDEMFSSDIRRHLTVTAATAADTRAMAQKVGANIKLISYGLDEQAQEMPELMAQVYRNSPDMVRNTRLFRVAFEAFWKLFEPEFEDKGNEAWRDVITKHWHKWLECWTKTLHEYDKVLAQWLKQSVRNNGNDD